MSNELSSGEKIIALMQETRAGILAWEERQHPIIVNIDRGRSFDAVVEEFVYDNSDLVLNEQAETVKEELGSKIKEWLSEDWLQSTALWALDDVICTKYRHKQSERIREIAGANPLRVRSLGLQAATIQKSEDILGAERSSKSYGMAKGVHRFDNVKRGELILGSPKGYFWFINALDKESNEPLVKLEVVG